MKFGENDICVGHFSQVSPKSDFLFLLLLKKKKIPNRRLTSMCKQLFWFLVKGVLPSIRRQGTINLIGKTNLIEAGQAGKGQQRATARMVRVRPNFRDPLGTIVFHVLYTYR